MGCVWDAELAYQLVNGFASTKVGYTQEDFEEPSYQQVCSGNTGHAEAVAIDYDEDIVKHEHLLDLKQTFELLDHRCVCSQAS